MNATQLGIEVAAEWWAAAVKARAQHVRAKAEARAQHVRAKAEARAQFLEALAGALVSVLALARAEVAKRDAEDARSVVGWRAYAAADALHGVPVETDPEAWRGRSPQRVGS